MPTLLRRLIAVMVILAGTLTLGILAAPPAGANTITISPQNANDTCSTDVGAQLEYIIDSQPSGTTVDLQPGGCYLVSTNTYYTFQLAHLNGITIDGQGATIHVPTQATGEWQPAISLFADTNIVIKNLNVTGGFNGSNGGSGHEGQYGFVFEADNGVLLIGDTVTNVQGDFMGFLAPNDVTPKTGALNTNVTVVGDTFYGAGYHGLTVESVGCPTAASCNGLTVENSSFSNMGLDAMDFEYDDYSTCLENGLPIWAAENNVTIQGNQWTNWLGDWFASLQGQNTPDPCNNNAPGGVSEQNLQLLNNTLNTTSPLFEVVATHGSAAPYLANNWTIQGNGFSAGNYAYPYHGSNTDAALIQFVTNLSISQNNFPLITPNEYVFGFAWDTGGIAFNHFDGAVGVEDPVIYGPVVPHCWNTYGPGGSLVDTSC